MRLRSLLLLAIFVAIQFSCSKSDDNDDTIKSDISLFDNVKNTSPVFMPDDSYAMSTQLVSKSDNWGSGNAIYTIYGTLRSYTHPDDDGKIDRSNIYKSMFDLETLFNSDIDSDNLLSESKDLTPAFDFGNTRSYDSYIEKDDLCLAFKALDNSKSAIIGWHWYDDGNALKRETGVAQLVINNDNTEIDIDMVFAVDYDIATTETDYNIRLKLTGNPTTHEFEFQYRIGSTSIVASGISQGANNYFLFKVKGDGTPNSNTTYYFVIPADADEEYLKNLTFDDAYTNSDDITDTNVANYLAFVRDTPFFDDNDMVTDMNDLNKGNNRQGTMYVNYQ
ncbi:MAG: hypothetical protein JXA53_03205 [Bacteroidales bacterium]|nr:hypothetical protein [Bacteroidales bacterium]